MSKLVCIRSVERLLDVLNPFSSEQDSDAAVALIFRRVMEDFEVLLVRRVESFGDPWSGQMAMPGGKRSSEDQDLKQTVVRETLEETNIDLIRDSEFFGVMTAFTSTQRPEIKILPFVFLLDRAPLIKLNKKELESLLWIPMEELFRSNGTAKFDFGEFPAYILGDTVIWGLTYRILKEFERLISRSTAW